MYISTDAFMAAALAPNQSHDSGRAGFPAARLGCLRCHAAR